MPADTPEASGPQVWDDMTVEVALAVMASARTDRLLVTDGDGLCSRPVSRTLLAAVRAGDAYTDRVRLRDVLGDRRFDAPPGTDERGRPPGVLALAG